MRPRLHATTKRARRATRCGQFQRDREWSQSCSITKEMRAQLSQMPDALKQDSMDAMYEYADHPTSTKDIVASSHSTKFHSS